ncbi:CRISPR-associated ring nuclease Csm6 [Dechloromonas sp.]|uniref:CRISPR-associated ring nuclease Csm6 n=1 Tax=Dechloromonas sp. TaxID=1917218 RepID=UPI00217048A6|nr:CRISPR-associated ring nuclease Csm6 [Dechloromonas sp.]MBU3696533.1 TIGR02584 family CRISPR-associated protein [Dechloromonas sp.]
MTNAHKRILLAVTGLSPQILTETLYALTVAQSPAWIPDEIHLISSKEGAEHARLSLLDTNAGQFHAFCRDYPVARRIHFSAENIHVIRDEDGHPLSDIRSPEDNARSADAIHALVRQFTADPTTELHVSIAGGRKTMGFYLGYSLSLTARPQDKLSHILVSDPFESLTDFYFPPATPRLLHTRDGRPLFTADARIMLAEIPFVRLRNLLPTAALAPELSFSDAVAATQAHLEQPSLRINIAQRQIQCGGKKLSLPPQLFAWYAWLAQRSKLGLAAVRHTDANPDEFLDLYAQIISRDAVDWENAASLLTEGFPKEFFEQKRAKVNSHLNRVLGLSAPPYLITRQGKRPLSRYSLALEPENIVLE